MLSADRIKVYLHGGKVHRIRPHVLHLMRGQVFDIEGHTFFTMGGVKSVRKPTDYSELFASVDRAVSAAPPQMELYREIGRLICERPEKGAAVAAAEYL